MSRSLDNDARIAGGRVDSMTASLDQLKKQASSNNGQDVQLRALEREAKAQRDLLESYLAKYREADRARKHRLRPVRRPHHLPRQRVQHPGLSQETADRADRDAGDAASDERPDRDRRIAADDRAACLCGSAGGYGSPGRGAGVH